MPSSRFSFVYLVRRFRRGMSMLIERIDDLRPHWNRQSMSHAFDHQKVGPGYRGCGVLAAFRPHQGVDSAVNDESRRFDRAQPFLSAAGGEDRAELPSDAGGVEPALECALRARQVERLVF